MYGLPIFRKETESNPPPPCPSIFGCCTGPGCAPPKLKSSLKLAEMIRNHYSLIISADLQTLAAWGNAASYGACGGTDTPKPKTVTINWTTGFPEYIVKVYSYGYDADWAKGFTIFRTESNSLYGTGYNTKWVLNRAKQDSTDTYNIITKNVIDFCVSGNNYLLYVKSDEKVYGLGPSCNGFGFPSTALKALIKDDGVSSNYVGLTGAFKVFTTSPDENIANCKSFVLKTDGTVVACGSNTDGCLGVNSNSATIYEWAKVKTSYDGGTTVSDLTGVIDVITTNWVVAGGANGAAAPWTGGSGIDHMSSYFLTKDGSVYTCGNNKFGQLGLGLATSQISISASKTSITGAVKFCTTAGGTSILVATENNEVYTWGNNQWGQLGLGHTNDTATPTKITGIPAKKIVWISGGGLNSITNGAFLVVFDDGMLYAAGYNRTFALGITLPNANPNIILPNSGPITTFTRNEFFGENAPRNQDPERYPLVLTVNLTAGNTNILNAELFKVKTVLGTPESVYITSGMSVSGIGIPAGTTVGLVNLKTKEVIMSNAATTSTTSSQISCIPIIRVIQTDLCGYGTEMAQKVVTSDGTLYMSGWNQSLGTYNFNAFYVNPNGNGNENVETPTFFDAKLFL
jgi:alpha-tubulin suppressor-like RCC1 family protein